MKFSKSRSVSSKLRERSQIVLLAAQGLQNKAIAARTGHGQLQVGRWRKRYAELGLAGIEKDKSRPGRIKPIAARQRSAVIRLTVAGRPQGATHWRRASMAKTTGISESSVGRIWAAHGLKPHKVKGFKLSNDPHFQEKRENIVGLYLSPPEHALVLSCDEKSQIQALDRTQPGLPLKQGRCQPLTHDYKRNGVTSLFAAMDVADGRLIGKCMRQHRHQEWLSCLRLIDQSTPPDKAIHIICDNYATHKHERVRAWLKRHRRFRIHVSVNGGAYVQVAAGVIHWQDEI